VIRARASAAGIALLVPVAIVVFWWFASADSTSPYYPSLETILSSFRETWLFAHFSSDIVPSLKRLFAGYALAVAVGIGLGILLGRIRTLDAMFQPTLQFSRAIPAAALVPIGTTVLGIGDAPKIWIIAFVCVFPILLNTIDGVRSVEPGLEDVGRSFRLTRRQRVLAIQLPSAAPAIFAGMRIALAFAFIMMIVTEMVAASSGIGFVTLNAQQGFQIPQMWAGMVLLAVLGATLNVIFVLVEGRVLRWHFRSKGE
jgi:ABC-type nitrate/sulfonate/bicarbonate transport system permease component